MDENKKQETEHTELENQQAAEGTESTEQPVDVHENQENQESQENQQEESAPDPLAEAEEKIKELNDKYLRLVAEFDNFRKRMMRERQELIKNASEELIGQMLEVLDDMDRAAAQMDTNQDPSILKEGVSLVFQKFRKLLEAKGLTEIPAIGEDFNTDLHEAITEIPAGDESKVGKVIDQVSKGYKLNDKVIRHAKVVVGK